MTLGPGTLKHYWSILFSKVDRSRSKLTCFDIVTHFQWSGQTTPAYHEVHALRIRNFYGFVIHGLFTRLGFLSKPVKTTDTVKKSFITLTPDSVSQLVEDRRQAQSEGDEDENVFQVVPAAASVPTQQRLENLSTTSSTFYDRDGIN